MIRQIGKILLIAAIVLGAGLMFWLAGLRYYEIWDGAIYPQEEFFFGTVFLCVGLGLSSAAIWAALNL